MKIGSLIKLRKFDVLDFSDDEIKLIRNGIVFVVEKARFNRFRILKILSNAPPINYLARHEKKTPQK